MSLIKNDYPILEYDTESKAIIMPGHSTDFHFPERAIMLFMETEVDNYALENDCEIIGQFNTVTKVFNVYKTIHNGVELAVCQAPLGGAAATQSMEQLVAGGVKKIIAASPPSWKSLSTSRMKSARVKPAYFGWSEWT